MTTLALESKPMLLPAKPARARKPQAPDAIQPGANLCRPIGGAAPLLILGVPFDNVTTADTLARIEAMIASGQPHFLATANVDFVVQALHDLELRRILLDADLVLADGMPLVWASHWLGNPLPERVAGSDLVPRLLAEAEQKGWRVFFLGGTEASVAAAAANARARHPQLQLVGAFSPPFTPLLEMDHDEILDRIRAARPDILLVAFGCPKQEKWINMHHRATGVPVCIGVGATIDFLAGTVSRAPRWMQRSGLEWVYRLLQEPGRLFRRYANDFWCFGRAIVRQGWQLRNRGGSAAPTLITLDRRQTEPTFGVIEISPRLDAQAVSKHEPLWEEAVAVRQHLVVDLANVAVLDSTGVGLLARLEKRLRNAGKQLVLLAPSTAVNQGLSLMGLTEFLPAVATLDEARRLLAQRDVETPVAPAPGDRSAGEPLVWQGEVVAANADHVWRVTEAYLRGQSPRARKVEVSLAAVRFMDSSGVAVMVRARKFGQARGLAVTFTRPASAVRQVIRMLRLDTTLLGGAA